MITGIRSAIICDEVQREGDTANYLGIWGDPLVPMTRPGVLSLWVALQVGLDEKAASGHMRIYTPDFDKSVPFDVPPGWRVADMSAPFIIPVLSEGFLTVAVVDDRRPKSPYRVKWTLAFNPGAPALDEAEVRAAGLAGEAAAAELVAALAQRREPPH
jgi:hypothetical protein